MSEEIIKVLNAICDKFGIVIDWSNEYVIPYMQSLLERVVHYEVITSILWVFLCLILLCITLYIGKRTLPNTKTDDLASVLILLGAFLLLFGTVILTQMFDLINCYIIPERVFIDYILEYVRIV